MRAGTRFRTDPILTASRVVHRGGEIGIAVDIDETLDHDEPLEVRAELLRGEAVALEAVIADEGGAQLDVVRLSGMDGGYGARVQLPHPGTYEVTVRGAGSALHQVSPITTAVLVWPTMELDTAERYIE